MLTTALVKIHPLQQMVVGKQVVYLQDTESGSHRSAVQ
jgi:hypothetical protein